MAVAQYFRDRATNLAEVAFMVDDHWQRQGLGTQLFQALASTAERLGIRGFTAEVLFENHAMMHLFQSTGLEISSSIQGGTYHLEMPFRLAPHASWAPARSECSRRWGPPRRVVSRDAPAPRGEFSVSGQLRPESTTASPAGSGRSRP